MLSIYKQKYIHTCTYTFISLYYNHTYVTIHTYIHTYQPSHPVVGSPMSRIYFPYRYFPDFEANSQCKDSSTKCPVHQAVSFFNYIIQQKQQQQQQK